jgi:hypothetical protein
MNLLVARNEIAQQILPVWCVDQQFMVARPIASFATEQQ